ncbi:unnamed protein product [Ceratitis capitata]|uniref:(Mediterranean fruit fly) hypothetical protein n=1 Tax=Ceratitis capitata TaxID=7213 RepID=A0A811UJ60_CERCA|nr:unnamed protein product [Ceratitis capitata]
MSFRKLPSCCISKKVKVTSPTDVVLHKPRQLEKRDLFVHPLKYFAKKQQSINLVVLSSIGFLATVSAIYYISISRGMINDSKSINTTLPQHSREMCFFVGLRD